MIKIHHLGIDFGSSKTSVVGYNETEGRFVLFYDRNAPSTQAFQTSTAVKMNGDQITEYAFFRKAEDIVWSENSVRPTDGGVWKSVETLKESLVETNAVLDSREQITRECVKQFFYEICDALMSATYEDYNGSDTYDFSELKSIVYGYPEYYTPNASSSYKKILEGILKEVFDGYGTGLSVTGVAEPELAAYAYHYAHRGDSSYVDRLQDRDKVLILDFGGHTLDIMVMQVQKGPRGTALKQYTRPGSDCYFVLLGKEITRKICNEIYDSDMIDPTVENAKCRLLAKPDQIGGDDQTPSKPHRMRTVCQGHDAFRLCYHSDAVRADQKEDHVALVGVYDRNGVDLRSEYRKAYNQIKDYLDMCYVETENIQHVLFAGGGACIADLRSYILDMLLNGRPASQLHVCGYFDRTGEEKDLVDYQDGSAIALSFKNAVAWGAALVSSGKQTLSERAFRDIRVNVREFSAQLLLRDLALVLDRILTDEQKIAVSAVYERHRQS
jgi:hypothetical protein